jgi:hypothetical protein
MAETKYKKDIAYAEINECRIERIFVKDLGREEIRFSWWPNGRYATRALDLPEDELLPLLEAAISKGVFTSDFLSQLRKLLDRAA